MWGFIITSWIASSGPGAGGPNLAGNLDTIWGLKKLPVAFTAYPPLDPFP